MAPLVSAPSLQGEYIDLDVTPGDVDIPHGLGRVPQFVTITGTAATPSPAVWVLNKTTDQTIRLSIGGTGAVRLWVT
jgi:hypothetical protein